MKHFPAIARQPKAIIVAEGLLGILIVGLLDYLTGWELTFFLFYLFPIAFVTYYEGKWPGLGMCLAGAVTWLLVDSIKGPPYAPAFHYWNTLIRLCVFIMGCLLLAMVDETQQKALERYKRRLDNMRQIDRAILAAHSTHEIAQAALEHIRRLIPSPRISVLAFDLDLQEAVFLAVSCVGATQLRPGIRWPLKSLGAIDAVALGKTCRLPDIRDLPQPGQLLQTLAAEGVRSYLATPLLSQGKVLGTFNLGSDQPGGLDPEYEDIAREVADQLAVAFEHARLFEQVLAHQDRLLALSRRLISAQEDERRQIARELHDQVGQGLTMVKLNLQALQDERRDSFMAGRVEDSLAIVTSTLDQVRDLTLSLRPAILDDLGLVPAARWYLDRQEQRSGLQIHFAAKCCRKRFAPEVEITCFRILQEALTNVVRHARARHVHVELREESKNLELIVRDDGIGFDVAAAITRASQGSSLGLLGMQERAAQVGGRIEWESATGHGSEVRVHLPVRDPPRNVP